MDLINAIKIMFGFLGGLGLFVYGMSIMAEGLQKAAGNKLRDLLGKLTKNMFFAIVLGAFVTGIIQSSSATTVMIVGFVNAGIMNLTQSVGVIMGANIGTTTTSWLVTASDWSTFLKPTTIAPITIAVGVILTFCKKGSRKEQVGEILVGFGILFFGISSMSSSVEPFKDSEVFVEIFREFGSNPILGILAGCLITMVIQSSSASVAILQTIVILGIVPWSAAIYIILGQNIGTCVTALLSSLGASKNAKAASYIHLLFNIIGSGIFAIGTIIFFKAGEIFDFIPNLSHTIITVEGVSIFHTAFNITATLMLIPFANGLVILASKLAGITEEENDNVDRVKLDDRLLETPAIAIETAFMEVARLGKKSLASVESACQSILTKDRQCIEKSIILEDEIDELEESIAEFLTEIMKKEELFSSGNNDITSYFHIINDFERIGDHAINICDITTYMIGNDIEFSEEGVEDIKELSDITIQCLKSAIIGFSDDNVEMSKEACRLEDVIDSFVKSSKDNHINRLSKDDCSIKSGIAFLDLIANFERISDHARNVAEHTLDI